ncbi:MAG TPA: glycoside hydrolase family 30 beta sandwich domain-containing protein [Longimicrobiaceae bacterium]|nr:glycoside hydrolase family 30 beta sandwich domain-containing protein [Longimicrobiaceae bacterium]
MKSTIALILAAAGCAACSGAAATTPKGPPPPSDSTVATGDTAGVWMTTADRTKFVEHRPPVGFQTGKATAPYTLTVDDGTQYQSIVGFGAAFTDASTYLIQEKLSPEQRLALLTSLFSPTEGLGLSFMRVTMGSSDFSRSDWSYDDMPAGQRDTAMVHFSIEKDREAMLPVIRQAREINPDLALMATPWSPPGWMKTTGSMIQGHLRDDAYGAYARYFQRFLQAYDSAGVPVQYISVQNEPDFEPANYPGMKMSAAERAKFVGRYLGPLLEQSGIQTGILDWDHNWDEPQQPLGVLADSAARGYVDGVAWHCYAGDISAMSTVHDAYPNKDTFFTECSGGEWSPDYAQNLNWFFGTLIIDGTRNWARGVAFWNLALDPEHGPHTGGCDDCRGVVTIDPASGRATYNVEYFALAQASRFVRPGARRIASNSDVGGLKSVAFRNPDGSTALLVLNGATEERSFDVAADGKYFAYTLPAGAAATFRWP